MTRTFKGCRALVTGGAGFIGSHIVDRLLAAGAAHVVVLDDLSRGRLENLDAARRRGRLDIIEGDIRDAGLVDDAVREADFVFHQAALRITQCAAEPVHATEVMINGLQNVLESAVHHGVKKVIAASSASVYGQPSELPMNEDHPFNNRTLYGALKIAGEQMLRSYTEMHDLKYVSLRPFNVYGPRMDVHGVYTEVMIRWLERLAAGEPPVIMGDGLQTMDFVFVEDVAEAYLRAAISDAHDDAFNVGTGTEVSLRELCRQVCAAAGHPGVEPQYVPARTVNPVTRRQAGIERAERELGFRAATSLSAGLRALVEWHGALRTSPGDAMGCVA
jgi:UDP-glucose 4-epimerase